MKTTTTNLQNSYLNQTTESNNILSSFDFSGIAEKDPSLSQGHRLIYDCEIPFEIRLEDKNGPQDAVSFEAIRCKILIGGDVTNPAQIRIELSCENDLFFHFSCDVDEETFKLMQESQKITANYREFSNLVIKLLNYCKNDPQIYTAIFIINKEKTGRLDFVQNIKYKFIELLSVDFVNSPDETIKKHISYRYNAVRTKLEIVKNRIKTITNIVKDKNPSLLLQIQKAPAKLNNNTLNENFTMSK